MTKSRPPNDARHPDDLLLPFVEDLLDPDEKAAVEEHIFQCAECSARVKELRQTIETLRINRDAFCPEPWELYEFAVYGRQSVGSVADHLTECQPCREMVQSWAAEAPKEQMPAELWAKVNRALSAATVGQAAIRMQPAGILERLRGLFNAPTWAVGAVTVAILLVIIFYPWEVPQSTIALSSVTWEGVPKPKVVQPVTKRVAIIVALKNFQPPLSRAKINALYEAVAPTMDIYERYDVLTPFVVSEAVKKGLIDTSGRAKMLHDLRSSLDCAWAILVTAVAGPDGIGFEAEFIDAATGMIQEKRAASRLSEADLGPAIHKAVTELLQGHK
ncbi:MAG TPA: zf-HC2 domain-containing protein [Desulfomonilaceae bacterium]|nr:zf-HC2 domain-containing protein [Desulfomonilaceae bacterium]